MIKSEKLLLKLPSYTDAEQIFEVSGCKVFRARQKQDDESVLIKWLGHNGHFQWFESMLQHEYEVSRKLALPGIIRPRQLIEQSDVLALIMEDVSGGVFLHSVLAKQQPNFNVSLDLIVQLAEILHNLHQNRIVHKDIRPANILVDTINWKLHLTGFGMASTHLQDKPVFSSSLAYLDHLAYISPEQTGRMNCDVDYRSDFYSLGITLYQLLTGQLPFNRSERLALIHDHLAVRPVPVRELCPDIPKSVSAIVDKLLQKRPEDRYQSAAGLKRDLQICTNQWQKSGTVIEFQLAEDDFFEQFLIPTKLYGREHTINLLEQSFNKVTNGGIELVLLSGPAGIGKTTLVREVFKSITAQTGLFIASKFTETEFKAPYSAWIRAFRYHLLNLISQGETEIEYWRSCLMNELGDDIHFLIPLIPELEQIISVQDRRPDYSEQASNIWFITLLVKFIRAFCRSKHPLTIFLDDIQWADTASLELITFLASSVNCCPGCQHLLIVCAYRDTEINSVHPLSLILDKGDINHVKIQVEPLAVNAINDWFKDILHVPSTTTQALAGLLYKKTEGNPLFIKEIIKSFHHQNAFTFDKVSGAWRWNSEQVDTACQQLDFEGVIAQNFEQLDKKTKQIIQLAACIGTYFDLQRLVELSEYSLDQIRCALDEAVELGIIMQLDIANTIMESSVGMTHLTHQDYRFTHDLIHQSVYQQMSADEHSSNHGKIGLKWLSSIEESSAGQQIFDCANQLNRGLNALNSNNQHTRLAGLNQNAGLLANSIQAFSTASTFFNQGLDILKEDGWNKHYPLMLQLTTLSAKSAFLTRDYDLLETRYLQICDHAVDRLDKSVVQQFKLKALIAQHAFPSAIDFMLQTVRELGIEIPVQPGKMDFWVKKITINRLSKSHNLKNFSDRPLIDNPKQLAVMELLCNSLKASFISMPKLFAYTLQKLTLLSFEYGNNPLAATAFIGFGGLCCEQSDDIEGGFEIALAGTKLLAVSTQQENDIFAELLFYCFVAPWKQSLPDILPKLEQVLVRGLSLNDTDCTECAVQTLENYMYFAGFELSSVSAKIKQYDKLMINLECKSGDTFNPALRQTLSVLTNRSFDACNRTTVQSTFFGEIESGNDKRQDSQLFLLHFQKATIDYLFCRFDDASISMDIALQHQSTALLGAYAMVFNFYDSLIRIAFFSDQSQQDKKRSLHQVTANQRKMKYWANYCPHTCQHKYFLIEAELASVEDQQQRAGEYYENAIEAVQQTGNLLETALVWELAAHFNIRKGRNSTGQLLLEKAYQCYGQWGGWAKIRELNQRYPEQAAAHNLEILTDNPFRSRPENVQADSLNNALKAIEILSNASSDTQALYNNWMKLITEACVAQKTVLIVRQSGKLRVVAESLENGSVISGLCESIESYSIPTSIVNKTIQAGQKTAIYNLSELGQFIQDPYFGHHNIDSVLCIPVVDNSEIVCVIYIENVLTRDAFAQSTIELLSLTLLLGWFAYKYIDLTNCLQTELSNIDAERKSFIATEARLRESKNHTQAILETSLDAVISIDAKGLVIDWSAKAETIFGWTSNETMGNPLSDFIIPVEHRETHKKGMERFLRTGQGKVVNKRIEITGLRSDGEKIPVELAIAPIFSDGKYTFSAFIRDLTEQKTIEIELNQQREALYQSEKLSSLGTLLAGVSHELNNPLSVVVGRSMMLQAEVDDEKTVKALEIIKNSAERCSRIVKSFLAIARQQEPNYELIQINELLHAAIDLVTYGLSSDGVDCVFDLQENLPIVSGDIDQLRQVFSNIIINAHQALQTIDGPRQIQLSTRTINDAEIVVTITDNGPGVPEDIRHRIFDPFYTSKPVGEGTGFGLSYSRGVVESHAGSLQLENPAEGGAQFVIQLPTDHFEIQSTELDNESSQSVKQPFSLLIVDDELDVAEMLSDILKKEGHDVTISENGLDALKICQTKVFDLIICDLHMPKLDGINFSKQLIQRRPDMNNRIVFITGDSLGMGDSNAIKATGAMVIEKPVIPDDFAALINRTLIDLEVD